MKTGTLMPKHRGILKKFEQYFKLNSRRKNDVKAQVEFTLKVMEMDWVTCYWCISCRDSLLVYVLKFCGILAGRCGSVVVRKREIRMRKVRVRPWAAKYYHTDPIFFLFNRKTLNNRSKCLQNCSDRSRKGNLPRLHMKSNDVVKAKTQLCKI